MKYRKLRIAWSVLFGLLCLTLIVLWVRSYWWSYQATYVHSATAVFALTSTDGQINFISGTPPMFSDKVSGVSSWKTMPFVDTLTRHASEHRFRFIQDGDLELVSIPHWFAILLTGTVAALPWLRWRFSLRTLLMAMTLVAVVLGWIVYAFRN
jgi:hypothetical protein